MRISFIDNGPGISSRSLENGLESLNEYKLLLSKLLKEKNELINAYNLFNLDVMPYEMLSLLVYDIEQLDKIFAFYIEFQG